MRLMGSRRWFRAQAPARLRRTQDLSLSAARREHHEPITSGPATSRIFRWRLAFCIWWRLSTGPLARFWRALSNTMDTGFCIAALDEALGRTHAKNINTDQARSSPASPSRQARGRGHCDFDGRTRSFMDNIFIERLWVRSNMKRCI